MTLLLYPSLTDDVPDGVVPMRGWQQRFRHWKTNWPRHYRPHVKPRHPERRVLSDITLAIAVVVGSIVVVGPVIVIIVVVAVIIVFYYDYCISSMSSLSKKK